MTTDVTTSDLHELVAARFAQSTTVPTAFFAAETGRIAEACWAMARCFHQGGRLLAFGNGAWASDAQHVAVEFVHPVIVGKRALPAIALANDSALLGNFCNGHQGAYRMPFGRGVLFAHQLVVLGRPQDIALGFSPDGRCPNVLEALAVACEMEMLTLGVAGGDGGVMRQSELDFCFVVPTTDPFVLQETHETLYHVLWELVHLFFEHEGLLT